MPIYGVSVGPVGGGYSCVDSSIGRDSLGAVKLSELDALDVEIGSIGAILIIKLHQYDERNNIKFG